MARAIKSPFAAATRQVAAAPLGLVPLPLRWTIAFGPPLATAAYGPDAAGDLVLVSSLADQVRGEIQQVVAAGIAVA